MKQISQPSSTRWPTRREWALGIVLIVVTLIVYGRACRFGFVNYDDPEYVTLNVHVLRGLSIGGFGWAFSEFHDANWIPLTWLSLVLDATLHPAWPGGYHLTNILLHVANVLLLFATLIAATRNSLKSFFAAALFAVHPLHVESVAWIAERKDVLSVFFGLLSLWAYVRSAQKPWSRMRFLALACFVCSLMSKQTLVTLPFVFLLLDYWPLERIAPHFPAEASSARAAGPSRPQSIAAQWLRLIVDKIPFFAASAAFCCIAMVAQSGGGAFLATTGISLSTRVLNAILAYGLYVRRAIFPADLTPYYPHPGSSLSLTSVGLSLVFLAAVTIFAVMSRRRRAYFFVGWLWFLGTLVPMIGLVQIGNQQMADRYAYFPLIGLDIALVWILPASILPATGWRWGTTIACGIVAAYAVAAFVQVGYWRNSITLWAHAIAVNPDNPEAQGMFAEGLLAEGHIDEAIGHLRQSIKLSSDYSYGHFLLGYALQRENRVDEAIAEYNTALSLQETLPANAAVGRLPLHNALIHSNLGMLYLAKHQYSDARRELQRAVELDPNNAKAYANLATLYYTIGDRAQAVSYSERALHLDESLLGCHYLIVRVLCEEGHLDAAIARLESVTRIFPNDAVSRAELNRLRALKSQRPPGP